MLSILILNITDLMLIIDNLMIFFIFLLSFKKNLTNESYYCIVKNRKRLREKIKKSGRNAKMAKAKKEMNEAVKKVSFEELDAQTVEIIRLLESKREFLDGAAGNTAALSGRERLRLYGAGVKNFGFIKTAYDIAETRPDFTPKYFEFENMREGLNNFENMRRLVFELRMFLEAAENIALLESDALYHYSLQVYGNLREMTRRRIPGANDLYAKLREYFKRPKRNSGEPTQKELERDFKKVLRGEASGEVMVANESPVLKAGKRKVVDRVNKGKRVAQMAGEESGEA
jgi:hypothetical protein